jgi:hypothetical protein
VDKLDIRNEMAQFDRKNRRFYDELSDEEKKKFSPFLMIRWGSSVQGSSDLQHFYLVATNERLNKSFFNIPSAQHKKLQWLVATTISPDMGPQRHNWLSLKKKEPGANSVKKQLMELYPHMKDDEIELMALLNTKKDLDEYLKAAGQDTKKK